jgi:heme ABC exporter ATP-binding subunit CcmA
VALAIRFLGAVSLGGRFPLLAGVTFDIAEGEVVHLRGPNGAGKSSLLRACAGLIPIHSGEAFVLGHDLRADRVDVRREVGLLGHTSFLYDELTVEDNLRFFLRAARVDAAMMRVGLDRMEIPKRLRSVRVGRLSAGQRRRVSIASLVARSPRLWLLDEPHAGLDAQGRIILDEVVGEVRACGATVVLASHELERAGELCDRVLEMAGGQVITVEDDTPKNGVERPVVVKDAKDERLGRDVA